jgi:hypothetical protein
MRFEPNNPIEFNKHIAEYGVGKTSKEFGVPISTLRSYVVRNNLPVYSRRFTPTNKEEFIQHIIKYGKAKTATKYNITLSTVIGYCTRNNIEIEPYKGLKHKCPIDKNELKQQLTEHSLNELSNKFNVSRSVIKRWASEYDITFKTKVEEWKSNLNTLKDNISIYQKENETKYLYEIAHEYSISLEQLKKAFKETNTPVLVHSYNESKGESEVRDYLKSLNIEVKKLKHSFNDITFELDCYVESHNFAIEYCGEYWHSTLHKDKKYHQEKWQWCFQQGITLITLFEHEWKTKKDLIQSMIKSRLGMIDNKIMARKCKVIEISSNQAKEFHNENHISGGLYSKFNYGLVYDDELVSAISLSKNRFCKDNSLEIVRFSSKKYTQVVGGFSKLLNRIESKSITTFADLRFGLGTVYEKCGFEFDSITPPNYWYFHKSNSSGFESRIKYQKHKLEKRLPHFNIHKTEMENMLDNGYYQIYDCGNYKYKLDK